MVVKSFYFFNIKYRCDIPMEYRIAHPTGGLCRDVRPIAGYVRETMQDRAVER